MHLVRPAGTAYGSCRPPCADAGRGARGGARRGRQAGFHRRPRRQERGRAAALELLAAQCGALLATSAAAKGLFRGSPWDLDVSGGFASPLAAELIGDADLIVGWGCSLNMWTTRHGNLIGPSRAVAQVDSDKSAIGAHRPVQLGVVGDVALTAQAVAALLSGDRGREAPASDDIGYRSAATRDRIAARSAGATSRTRTRATASESTRAP